MARPRPEGQLEHILDTAESVFVRAGVQRAKMSTIAADAGVSEATLYYYFEHKDALFAWTLRRVLRPELQLPTHVPLGTPPGFDATEVLRSHPRAAERLPMLAAATHRAPGEDLEAELRALLGELFDEIASTARIVDLVEAKAATDPTLADAWYGDAAVGDLERLWVEYFDARQHVLRLGQGVIDAALWVILNCSYFARVRRRFEPIALPADEARASVIEMLLESIVPRR